MRAAEESWANWQSLVNTKLASSAPPPPENELRNWAKYVHPPTPWIEPSNILQPTQNLQRMAPRTWAGDPSDPPQPSSSPLPFYYDPPLPQAPRPPAQNCIGLQSPPGAIAFTPYAPLPQITPNFKRTSAYIDLTGEDENEDPAAKRLKLELEPLPLTADERFELSELERTEAHVQAPVKEKKVELSEEQQKVVDLAVKKKSIFLTGAAGSGKTVTLKEILRRLRAKKKGGHVQVIAPTGIAALPLGGKTTYSFAGVSICHKLEVTTATNV